MAKHVPYGFLKLKEIPE
ncbi:unnamed protein product [Tuber melanosporum]|uniref:(Perigord truffle) hypothetical protein n=1 Tax=Tuber melanosporum (strain Mel28) TaxID=656061 RepID=D5GCG0_TUBMM|nr:unnamed protein product [Tuber melanosporum]